MFSTDAPSAQASSAPSGNGVGSNSSQPADQPSSSQGNSANAANEKGKNKDEGAADAGRKGEGNTGSPKGKDKDDGEKEDGQGKPRPSTSELHLSQYRTRDALHAAALADQIFVHNELIRNKRREQTYYTELRRLRQFNPGAVFGLGYQGFGNGWSDGKAQIVYPAQKKKPGGRKSQTLRLSRKAFQEAAEQQEILVPVRLDIDYDKHKLRDTFTWNLHDRTVPVRVFSEQLVEDFHLPLREDLVEMVKGAIDEQLTEFHPHVFFEDQPLNPSLPYWAYKNDEMRILIKLNITIGHHNLVDQFEWDINNPQNSPEEFAQLLAREMSLSGEFATAIAHSIREQAQLYTKSLYMTNHPFDGRPIEDEDLRNALLPSPLPNTIRTAFHAKDYTPLLYELTDADLDRLEKSDMREERRKRRRRDGLALPDLKDVPKTHRSQIVSSVLPGAVQKVSDLRMHKRQARDAGESESEDSDSPEPTPQPTPAQLQNMTRRQRGAAANAAAALRNSAARSATPETAGLVPPAHLHHRPTPSPLSYSQRPGVMNSMLVKLKISKEKLQRFMKELDIRERKEKESGVKKEETEEPPKDKDAKPADPSPKPKTTPTRSTSSIPQLPAQSSTPSTDSPRKKEKLAPPPVWLIKALDELKETYPNDRYEAIMRQTAIDPDTEQPLTAARQQELLAKGEKLKYIVAPKIKCLDCPGKLYVVGPEDAPMQNFIIHVKNRQHREKVDQRLKQGGG